MGKSKIKATRRKVVGYLRKRLNHLDSMSPLETLENLVRDEQLRIKIVQSLRSTGWLMKNEAGQLIFSDGELGEKLVFSEHQKKFGPTCQICQKKYSKRDRTSVDPLAQSFGICRRCFWFKSNEDELNLSQMLAKILVKAATRGYLVESQIIPINLADEDCDPLLTSIEKLAEHFAQCSELVSAEEIKEAAQFRLRAFREYQRRQERKERELLGNLTEEIDALGIDLEYDLIDGAVEGKFFLVKIWIEGYGTTFLEGRSRDLVATIKAIMLDVKNTRFPCPACPREYELDANLWSLSSCRCGASYRWARLQSSEYSGANPSAAYDPWAWLLDEVKRRILPSYDFEVYEKALHAGVLVHEFFDGAYVSEHPFSTFPCFVVSKTVSARPFSSLCPAARSHLALSSLTSDIDCHIRREFGEEYRDITYWIEGQEVLVDGAERGEGIYLVLLSDESIVDYLKRSAPLSERDDLEDWYFLEKISMCEKPLGSLTSYYKGYRTENFEGWALFIDPTEEDSLAGLKARILASTASATKRAKEVLSLFTSRFANRQIRCDAERIQVSDSHKSGPS